MTMPAARRNPTGAWVAGITLSACVAVVFGAAGGGKQAASRKESGMTDSRKTTKTDAASLRKAPYGRWKNGLPTRAGYFPIAVWLQNPDNAKRYKAAGINLYVGLWNGPTEAQLAALKAAGMPVICSMNRTALARIDDPMIVGWMHGDEPDNAQPVTDPDTGRQSYGPPVPPKRIVSDYESLRKRDPTRPILLNLGQGVANDDWIGRGSEAKLEDYETYVRGADIVSFDVYPVSGLDRKDGENYLWYIAKGLERLIRWTNGEKPVWNCIETARIGSEKKATPHQVRAEVWMSIIHGSRGLIYFVHEFVPEFNEHALLDDVELLPVVTETNRRIHELAPVLNGPTLAGAVEVDSGNPEVPIGSMAKRHKGALYLFTVGMRNGATEGTFRLKSPPPGAKVEVIGEGRSLAIKDGVFRDEYRPYDVHLYRIKQGSNSSKGS